MSKDRVMTHQNVGNWTRINNIGSNFDDKRIEMISCFTLLVTTVSATVRFSLESYNSILRRGPRPRFE